MGAGAPIWPNGFDLDPINLYMELKSRGAEAGRFSVMPVAAREPQSAGGDLSSLSGGMAASLIAIGPPQAVQLNGGMSDTANPAPTLAISRSRSKTENRPQPSLWQ